MPSLEQVEMRGQHDARLHHVQVVDLRRIDARQRLGKQVGLLLVVAFEADPIARADDGFEKIHQRVGPHGLARRVAACGCDPRLTPGLLCIPTPHGHSPVTPPDRSPS